MDDAKSLTGKEPSSIVGEAQIQNWIDQARGGSRSAMGNLAETCRDYLLMIANQELDPELRGKFGASDIVQEALMEAQHSIVDFRGGSEHELLAWMRGILVNDLLDARRQFIQAQKRRVTREVSLAGDSKVAGPATDLQSEDTTPGSEAIATEEVEALRRAMKRLSDEYRQVLRLRNWQQLSFSEIGEKMGRSSDASRKLWSRAVERLQHELNIEHHGSRSS